MGVTLRRSSSQGFDSGTEEKTVHEREAITGL